MLFTRGPPGMLLATRRVAVVSGLALGSDGAAHVGARGRRRAMAVVPPSTSSTLRRQARLWGEVGERGVLLAEAACPSREVSTNTVLACDARFLRSTLPCGPTA